MMVVEEGGCEEDGEREREDQVTETATKKSHLPSWVFFVSALMFL